MRTLFCFMFVSGLVLSASVSAFSTPSSSAQSPIGKATEIDAKSTEQETLETADAEVSERLKRAGRKFSAGESEAALMEAEQALEMAISSFPIEHSLRIQANLATASMLMQTGDMESAAPLVEEAHQGASIELQTAEKRYADTLKFLGPLRMQRNDLEGAETAYANAVALSRRSLGPNHAETAKHLGNLAMIAIRRGDLERGRTLLLETMAIWEKQDAPDPVYTAGAMANLAAVEIDAGRIDDGIALFEDAVALQEASWGEDHPRLASMLTRYANALEGLGRESQAQALRDRIDVLDSDGADR